MSGEYNIKRNYITQESKYGIFIIARAGPTSALLVARRILLASLASILFIGDAVRSEWV